MVKTHLLRSGMLLVAAGAAAAIVAQTSTSTTAVTTSATTATTATTSTSVEQSLEEILEEPTSSDSYRYDPQGRRDPFQSLVGPAPKTQQGSRPAGVPGFLIDEMKFQGVVKTKQGFVAMINGPDNQGYLIHVGDKVLDGEVIRITPSTVVFRQEVNDPTRIERYREVVKDLNPTADKK